VKGERTISSKYIHIYRAVPVSVLSVLYLVMAYVQFQDDEKVALFFGISYLITAVMFGFQYQKLARLIKQVSYTDRYLYIYQKDQSTEIPLENIKDVTLTSLDGLYKFSFYKDKAPWKEIYCKVSMWYPFNYKKVDAELDYIRHLIRKRTHELSNDNEIRLPSGQ
jgi:hypothetical protein